MTNMKLVTILLITLILCAIANGRVFLEKAEASQYLKREKRANGNIIEEISDGTAEQECIEEVCDYEEVREVFENKQQADAYWRLLVDQCSTALNRCNETGTFRCESKYGTHVCVCKLGYVGKSCETKTYVDLIHVCKQYDNLCTNGGTCVDDVEDTYYCACPPGWYGYDCAQDINECEDEPCINGTCLNHFGSYECTCDVGYEGMNCDEETNECRLDFCPRGSECIDEFNSFRCVCPPAGCQAPSEDDNEVDNR